MCHAGQSFSALTRQAVSQEASRRMSDAGLQVGPPPSIVRELMTQTTPQQPVRAQAATQAISGAPATHASAVQTQVQTTARGTAPAEAPQSTTQVNYVHHDPCGDI